MTDIFNLEDDAPLRRVLYTAAILLVLIPIVQAGTQLWPLQPTSIMWRYQAANALSSVLLLPFLGLSLLLIVGRAMESRAVSRTVGIIAAIFAAGLAVSLVLFGMDALQLKAIVTSAGLQNFKNSSIRVVLVSVLFLIAFTLLALAGFRMPRGATPAVRRAAKAQPAAQNTGLLVGQE